MTTPKLESVSCPTDANTAGQLAGKALRDCAHKLQTACGIPTRDVGDNSTSNARLGLPECTIGDAGAKVKGEPGGEKTIQRDGDGRITDVETDGIKRHIGYNLFGTVNEVVTTNKLTGETTSLTAGMWDDSFTQTDSKGHSRSTEYASTGIRVEPDGTIRARHLYGESEIYHDNTDFLPDGREIWHPCASNPNVATVEKDLDGKMTTTMKNGDIQVYTPEGVLIDRSKDNEKPAHMRCKRYHQDVDEHFSYDAQHHLIGIETKRLDTGAQDTWRKDSNNQWIHYDKDGTIDKPPMVGTIDVSPSGDITMKNASGEIRIEHPNGEIDLSQRWLNGA